MEMALPPRALVVGFVGRHEEGKGIRVLRKALELAMQIKPDIHAVWVGSGAEWLATQSIVQASSAAHRHRFVDWTQTPERIYPAMDLLVTPSRAPETFGRVVAEAQACGVPVIASPAGGLTEAFAPGISGELFNGRDPVELADRILSLCHDRDRRHAMSAAGRQFAAKFDSRIIVKDFVEILGEPHGSTARDIAPLNSPYIASELAMSIEASKWNRQ